MLTLKHGLEKELLDHNLYSSCYDGDFLEKDLDETR